MCVCVLVVCVCVCACAPALLVCLRVARARLRFRTRARAGRCAGCAVCAPYLFACDPDVSALRGVGFQAGMAAHAPGPRRDA